VATNPIAALLSSFLDAQLEKARNRAGLV
jgi:hypothetical protein